MELNSPEELSKPIQNARLKVILPARKETGEYLDTDCISLEMGSAPGRPSFFDILSLPGLWAAWAPASNASSKVDSCSWLGPSKLVKDQPDDSLHHRRAQSERRGETNISCKPSAS